MSEKRLPQVGEVWFDGNGMLVGPLGKTYEGHTFANSHPLISPGSGWTYNLNGWHGHDEKEYERDNLALIHKDASGKVINPVFDPALIGQPEAQGKPAKPPKPDPLAQAIAESRERTKGLTDIQGKLAEQKALKVRSKALAAEIAALRAKYPIETKAAKAGRKGK